MLTSQRYSSSDSNIKGRDDASPSATSITSTQPGTPSHSRNGMQWELVQTPKYTDTDGVSFDAITNDVIHTNAKGGTAVDNMVASNSVYAKEYEKAGNPKLPLKPGKKLCVVTCMDSRIDVFKCFGLRHGDAHVIRNAGGRISEALRSVAISQNLLDTEEIAVIHHTECGVMSFTDEQMKSEIIKQRGGDSPEEQEAVRKQVEGMKMLSFQGRPEEMVIEDLRIYRASPIVKHNFPVRGFVYDVHKGSLTEVFDDAQTFDYSKHYETH